MKYWVGLASKEHVKAGVEGGFCQLCHGKAYPLKRMAVGDWVVFYSSKDKFKQKMPCQKFTAIGQVAGEEVYAFEMTKNFTAFRRDIQFKDANEVDIRPLISDLSFIPDKKHWGYPFQSGHFEINKQDFQRVATAMLTVV